MSSETPKYPVEIYEAVTFRKNIKNVIKFPFVWSDYERQLAIKTANTERAK